MRTIGVALMLLLAGCTSLPGGIGDEDTPEQVTLFLGATGDQDVQVELDIVQLTVDGVAEPMTVLTPAVDLGELATSGEVEAIGQADVSGEVTRLEVSFLTVTVDGEDVTPGRLTLDQTFTVDQGSDISLVVDLDRSTSDEDVGFVPQANSYVVEDGEGSVVYQATASDLRVTPPPPPPLPAPVITVEGQAVTLLRVLLSQEVQFGAQVPGEDPTAIEVFWDFGDGNTATGLNAPHAYREPGAYEVNATARGGAGRQSSSTLTVDVFTNLTGEGNVGVGTGGQDQLEDRDYKEHELKVPGEPVKGTLYVDVASAGGTGTPLDEEPNVFVTLYDEAGEVVAEDRTTDDPKLLFLDQALTGTYTLRISGDSGTSIGYSYGLEVHYVQ